MGVRGDCRVSGDFDCRVSGEGCGGIRRGCRVSGGCYMQGMWGVREGALACQAGLHDVRNVLWYGVSDGGCGCQKGVAGVRKRLWVSRVSFRVSGGDCVETGGAVGRHEGLWGDI